MNTHPCINCSIRRLALFRPIGQEELAEIAGLRSTVRSFERGAQILPNSGLPPEFYTLYAGWAFTYMLNSEGRRQIIDFHLPGDFLGLEQLTVEDPGTAIEALTPVMVCAFPSSRVMTQVARSESLATSMAEISGRREALLAEHILDLGRRNARERMAHLLLELFTRQRWRTSENLKCTFPPSQIHLADALGLSPEHVSRILREFRERNWAIVHRRTLTILNFKAMAELSDWSDGYLAPRALI